MKKRSLIFVFWTVCTFQYLESSDFTYNTFGSNIHVTPAAFGDFNSDEFTDLFVISGKNSHDVEVLLAEMKEPHFKSSSDLKCSHSNTVTSIVPGDYNGDALMDMLVTVRDKEDNGTFVHIYIHWGYYDNGENKLNCNYTALIRTWDEPLAITYRTDLRTDLFAMISDRNITGNLIRFNNGTPDTTFLFKEKKYWKMKYPHSHAFLDINEDNYADLLLTTDHGCDVYTYNEANNGFEYNPNLNFSYPNGWKSKTNQNEMNIGQTLIIDLESSDKNYLLLPVIKNPRNPLNKNQSSIWAYSFDTNKWSDLYVNFVDPNMKEWSFNYDGSSLRYLDVPTLRAGDFNNDGFVDLLATLKSETMIKTFLLTNVPCQDHCDGNFKRTFAIQWTALSPNNENAVMGVFFDFMQDGILDVIFVQYDSQEKKHRVSVYKNSLDYDANFIKVMVISGIENSKVQKPASSILSRKHFFGTNLPGPKIHYQTTNQDSKTQYGRTNQLAQSAHFALNLPYTIFGLGRTPNFIEDLVIGMFNETKQFSTIIPNSQLIIIIPDTEAKNPSKWRAQLFVTPSKIILQTVFALTGTCIVLAFIIGALHWKERREDRLERLQEAQRFHFDAM